MSTPMKLCLSLLTVGMPTAIAAHLRSSHSTGAEGSSLEALGVPGTTSPETLPWIREAIRGYGTIDENATDRYGAEAAVNAMERACGWDAGTAQLKHKNCISQTGLKFQPEADMQQALKEMDIVVPTIRDLDFLNQWKPFLENAHFILIQDGDPAKKLKIPAWVDYELYNRHDIDRILGNRAWVISSRDASIRNFGFLVSRKKFILTMDDDTFPATGPDGKLVNSFLEHYRNLQRNSNPSFFNTLYDPYQEGSDFVRGYPYSRRLGVQTVVSHGIWLNVPDYDAPTELSKPAERNRNYAHAAITVPNKILYPMCSMNLAFDRQKIGPAIMQGLMGVGQPWGRYDDMFAGWTSKVCADKLKLGVKTGHPYIYHNKASNPFTNLKKEYKGLEWQEDLINFFESVDAQGNTVAECYLDLAEKIGDHFGEVNPYFSRLQDAMRTWIQLWDEADKGSLKFTPSRSSASAGTGSLIATGRNAQGNKKLLWVMPTYPFKDRLRILCQILTLMQKQNVKLIMVEDGPVIDEKARDMLEAKGVDYEYLAVGPTHDKGHVQRNLALERIRDKKWEGIVYNGDADNWYDKEVFAILQQVPPMSVGFMAVGGLGFKDCYSWHGKDIAEFPWFEGGKIKDWCAGWKERAFPIDMAGFAFDAQLLQGLPSPVWQHHGVGGESEFISKIKTSHPSVRLAPLAGIDHGGPSKLYVSHNKDGATWASTTCP